MQRCVAEIARRVSSQGQKSSGPQTSAAMPAPREAGSADSVNCCDGELGARWLRFRFSRTCIEPRSPVYAPACADNVPYASARKSLLPISWCPQLRVDQSTRPRCPRRHRQSS